MVEKARASASKEASGRAAALRVDLLNAQFDLRRADFAVLVLIAGDDVVGCNEVLRRLHEWMDARYLETLAFDEPTEDERARPFLSRTWAALPRKGALALHFGGWAHDLLIARLDKEIDGEELDRRLEHVVAFERLLAGEGALIVKLWVHASKKVHRRRARSGGRVRGRDARILERFERAIAIGERIVERTGAAHAPWTVIDGSNDEGRDLAAAQALRDALCGRLAARPAFLEVAPTSLEHVTAARGRLAGLDLSLALPEATYDRELPALQDELAHLHARARSRGVSTVLVFEGWDAAGKGGAIRRITKALDARDYHVVPVSAPSEDERAHPYLWRFWKRLPPRGDVAIFDRSWYGRVLVERVEGFASEGEWRRAYGELVDFEEQIVEHGLVLAKFWLHIDRETQLARFREREATPFKKYKIGADDLRNRAKWDLYLPAAEEMFARTSTRDAPWNLIPATDKRWARVAVLDLVCEALAARLGRKRRRRLAR